MSCPVHHMSAAACAASAWLSAAPGALGCCAGLLLLLTTPPRSAGVQLHKAPPRHSAPLRCAVSRQIAEVAVSATQARPQPAARTLHWHARRCAGLPSSCMLIGADAFSCTCKLSAADAARASLVRLRTGLLPAALLQSLRAICKLATVLHGQPACGVSGQRPMR